MGGIWYPEERPVVVGYGSLGFSPGVLNGAVYRSWQPVQKEQGIRSLSAYYRSCKTVGRVPTAGATEVATVIGLGGHSLSGINPTSLPVGCYNGSWDRNEGYLDVREAR